MDGIVPREQQLEGMKFVLARVDFQVYLKALDTLVRQGWMSKSLKHKYIKDARHILGMPYEEYKEIKARPLFE